MAFGVVLVLSLVIPLPPALGGLIAYTTGAVVAGRAAKVKGARWWIAAWVLAYVVSLALVFVPLLFLGSQVSEILNQTAP